MRLLIVIIFILNGFNSLSQNQKTASIERGQWLYEDLCLRCHMPNGEGVQGVFPPLANSDYLNDIEATIRIIKYGGIKEDLVVNGVTYNGYMDSQGLSDDEIADVTNYILNSWGNTSKLVIDEKEVNKIKPND
mgnify:FL=1